MLNAQDYLIFANAARLGSFAAAAERLGVSNSHVSKHIAALEARLGLRLFSRSPRLLLTDAGQTLLKDADQLRDVCERVERRAQALQREPVGVLRLVLPPVLARRVVQPALPAFLAAHPGLAVELFVQQAGLPAFAEGVDVVLTLGELADSAMVCQRLGNFDLLVVASPGYLQCRSAPQQPADLAEHNCLLTRFPTVEQPASWQFVAGERVEAVTVGGNLSVNDMDMCLDMAERGMGATVVPAVFAHAALRAGRLQQLLPDWRIATRPQLSMLYHDRVLQSRGLAALLAFLQETLARCVVDD